MGAWDLVCGAECGIKTGFTPTNSHWYQKTGTAVTIDTTVKRSGSKSYKFASDATDTYLWCAPRTASATVFYGRYYFRLSSVAPSEEVYLANIFTSAGSNATLSVTTGGVLRASFTGSGAQNGPTLSADTWYGFEWQVDLRNNPNTIDWRTWDATGGWVNRTQSSYAQAGTTGTYHLVGFSGGPASGVDMYIDDILLASGTTIDEFWSDTVGNVRHGPVLRYRPTADLTHSISADPNEEFEYSNATDISPSATDVYSWLDDDDQDSVAGDYITQNAVGAKYVSCSFDNESTYSTSYVVGITSTHGGASGTHEAHCRVSDDGTNWTNIFGDWTYPTGAGLDTGYVGGAWFQHILSAPPSGGSWTQTKVNGMRFQYGYSDTGSPRLHTISMEVAWSDVAVQSIRPDADVTTTGWSTAPLWSKIEEEAADGTVITAAAS